MGARTRNDRRRWWQQAPCSGPCRVGVPAAQSAAGPASPSAARWVFVTARLSEEKETCSDPMAPISREGVRGEERGLLDSSQCPRACPLTSSCCLSFLWRDVGIRTGLTPTQRVA